MGNEKLDILAKKIILSEKDMKTYIAKQEFDLKVKDAIQLKYGKYWELVWKLLVFAEKQDTGLKDILSLDLDKVPIECQDGVVYIKKLAKELRGDE